MASSNLSYLSSSEIVERYLAFFRSKGHIQLPSSPLAVAGGSTSFVIAGMQPLLPYLRGLVTPPSPRLTALQRCLRTDDAEVVGTNTSKNTAFHMLGNWSIGDYGKREAIEMALDLLLNVFSLDSSKLWVTVFAGDPELDLSADEGALQEWLRLGIPREHIVPLGTEDNLWTMGGPGPCGPCSEIFFDRGPGLDPHPSECRPGDSCERFLEIWNLVFMEYESLPSGSLTALPQRNIDTGMGLERIASVLQGAESVFSVDLFQSALSRLLELAPSGVIGDDPGETRARRIIVDHTRAVLFACLAGVMPGRDGSGSVVRRLLRRASRQARLLGIDKPFLGELLAPLVQGHGSLLTPDEHAQVPHIVHIVEEEEKLFGRVLTIGLRYLSQLEPGVNGLIPGELLFKLRAEKGFPTDLATEILTERGLQIDWLGYEQASEEHRRVSRLSAEKHFHKS
jgi:alanyl-tRNA synthetase